MAQTTTEWSIIGKKIEFARKEACRTKHIRYKKVDTQAHIAQELGLSLATYKRRLVTGDFSENEKQRLCELLKPFYDIPKYVPLTPCKSVEMEIFTDFCTKLVIVNTACSKIGKNLYCNIVRNGTKYFFDYHTHRLHKYCSFTPEDETEFDDNKLLVESILKRMGCFKKSQKVNRPRVEIELKRLLDDDGRANMNFRYFVDEKDYIELTSDNEKQFWDILMDYAPNEYPDVFLFSGIRIAISPLSTSSIEMGLEEFDKLYNTVNEAAAFALSNFLEEMNNI